MQCVKPASWRIADYARCLSYGHTANAEINAANNTQRQELKIQDRACPSRKRGQETLAWVYRQRPR